MALRFLPQAAYEKAAWLDIVPTPGVVTRVFMLFQGVPEEDLSSWKEAEERAKEDVALWKAVVGIDEAGQNNRDYFKVLEWGGMEVFR